MSNKNSATVFSTLNSSESSASESNRNKSESANYDSKNNSNLSNKTNNSSSANNNSIDSSQKTYSSEVNSLFSKLKSNSSSSSSLSSDVTSTSSSSVSSSSSFKSINTANSINYSNSNNTNINNTSTTDTNNVNNNEPNNNNTDDNYLQNISDNASSADAYLNEINTISSNIVNNSASISSISNKLNMLNNQIGLNRITLPDNESINEAAQAVAISIIKVNNEKIKALTARNSISGMTPRVKFDYENYLKAKRAIQTDVTGINTHMSNSSIAFNQGINTLTSHNSLITSYANQLSFDASKASRGVSNASVAARTAINNQNHASSAYDNANSLVNHIRQEVASTAKYNANVVDSVASEVSSMKTSATAYNKQIVSISNMYSTDSSIANVYNVISSNLKQINSNNTHLKSTASDINNELSQMNVNYSLRSLGTNYQHAKMAADNASRDQSGIVSAISNISSATNVAKSIASGLHAKQIALNDGANDYIPIAGMTSLDTENNTPTYIKYYKQGYQNARKGFHKRLYQLLSNKAIIDKAKDSSYRIGFRNARYFVNGINDARKRIIKNNREINFKHYNYGYNACQELINNNFLYNDKNIIISLKQALLLVIGYLIGSYN